MPAEAPRPTDDPWRDADGTHISLFCWVEQVAEHPEQGVLFSGLHKPGQVLGRGLNLLYLRFDGEGHLIGVSPQLVRLLPEPPDAEHGTGESCPDVEITLAGILVTDPELRLSSTGAVTSFTVAADERRFDPATSQWVNTGAVFLPCFIGRHAAENVAESLTKGTHIVVTGVLRQREWENTAGDKRYAYEVHATEVAVSLNYATVQITRTDTVPPAL